MGILLTLAFLFFIGSIIGWGMELLFRRFVSKSNPERKWINPGFCVGPYLPIYGCGLCVLYLIASLDRLQWFSNPIGMKIALCAAMAVGMTLIEYVTGLFCLKVNHVRLWDYSAEWGNIQGIICPKFSVAWAVLGMGYYFLIHPYILEALNWLSHNLAFSFFIGTFFGVFAIDVAYSFRLVTKLKRFAEENNVIVRYEHLKAHIRSVHERTKKKYRFLLPLKIERPLSEYLKEKSSSFEQKIKQNKKRKKGDD